MLLVETNKFVLQNVMIFYDKTYQDCHNTIVLKLLKWLPLIAFIANLVEFYIQESN